MRFFVENCNRFGACMNAVAGGTVFFMMTLTVADVVLRIFGKPIVGSYELVTICGAVVIAFALPKTSLDRGNISVDLLMDRCSKVVRTRMFVVTRIFCIVLFVFLTWFLTMKGYGLYKNSTLYSILQVPRYYLIYVLAFCCLGETVVLAADIVRGWDTGKGEER